MLSMIGDHFSMIAFPWLVLKMTGDPLALGTVLALIGIPRTLFMLVGGALVDRYSPKNMLMLMKYINAILIGTLAFLVLTNSLSLWVIYAISLSVGFTSAFSMPAESAILPHVVQKEHLDAANSTVMSIRQVTMLIGPLLAGFFIMLFGDTSASAGAVADSRGLGMAFLFDASTYAISALLLAKVAVRRPEAAADSAPQTNLLQSIAEGFHYCWSDVMLRTCFLYWAAITLFISGTIQVAMPVLATSLNLGAASFGMLLGAHSAGTLIGMILSGVMPKLRIGNLGTTILLVDCLIGLTFAPMGFITATWQGAILLLIIGTLGGFVQVAVFSWMQRRVPATMMGRTMSLFMLLFAGIAPISAAAAGWIMRSISLSQLFAGCGAMLFGFALIALIISPMKTMSES